MNTIRIPKDTNTLDFIFEKVVEYFESNSEEDQVFIVALDIINRRRTEKHLINLIIDAFSKKYNYQYKMTSNEFKIKKLRVKFIYGDNYKKCTGLIFDKAFVIKHHYSNELNICLLDYLKLRCRKKGSCIYY